MALSGHQADYHIHTRFSCDSDADIFGLCESAIARGMSEIAITDHVDFGPEDPAGYFKPLDYLEAIDQCRCRYGDRLTVRAGLELGEPHLFPEAVRDVLSAGVFDFVIGSAHYAALPADSGEDGLQCAWKAAFFKQPPRRAFESYFRQVARLAAEGDFDVLGHLDLVKRDAHKYGVIYDGPDPYADMIRQTLRSVVDRGKGIEINTSPLYKDRGMPEPCPSLQVLRWYREFGGEILTIGSDAHSPDKVGSHFNVARDMARSAGFKRLASFEGRSVRWNSL